MAQLVIWNAAKEYTEVMNLESGRVSNATISSNKGTWDKAGTSIQQSVDYNGVKMDATNGINVVSSQNTLLLNASKGIELKKKTGNETLFGVDASGNLIVKGNITMVGGSITWSAVTAPDYSQLQGTKPPSNASNTWSDLTTDDRYKGLFYTSNGNLVLKADAVVIGSNTKFDDGYDPSKIEIGSTNLIENGAFLNGTYSGWTLWGTPPKLWVDSQNTIKDSSRCISMDVNAANQGINQSVKVTVGKQYTMSAWVWCKAGATLRPAIMVNNNGEYPGVIGTKDGLWERISFTFVAKNANITAFIGRNGGAGTGTYSFVSVQLEEGNRVTDWKPSFKDVDNAVSDINNTVNNINIGGKNLLLKSDESRTTTDYLVKEYTLTENWVPGAEYTFVLKGTLPAGQTWGLWVNGSANRVAEVKTTWINGLMYVTFTCIAITAGFERTLRLYNTPQNTTSSTVEWVALYKGNKAMDWTPAPEDINQNITDSVNNVTIGARNLVLESLLDSTAPWIYDTATVKIESNVMPNGIKNFMATVVGTGVYKDITQYIPVEGNTEYTLSLNAGGSFSTYLWEKKADKTPTAVYKDNAQTYSGIPWDMSSPRSRFTRTIRTQPDAKYIQFIFRVNGLVTGNTSGRMALAKIERGNKATDYSPAPEDALNMNIGGRNTLTKSQLPDIKSNNAPVYPISVTETTEGSTKFLRVKNTKTGTDTTTFSVYNGFPFTSITENLAGQQITVSHKVRASKAVDMKLMALVYGGTEVKWPDNEKIISIDQNWKTISSTYIMPSNISGNTGIRFILYAPTTAQPDLYVDYREWKIELGGKATDWNPAPEDIYQTIDNIDVGGNNVVVNSDFRDGMRHWGIMGGLTQSIVDVTDLGAFTKASKMVIASTATDDNWTYTDYIVTPGDYILSAYFKSESAQCSIGMRDGTVAPLVYNIQRVGVDQTGKNKWFRAYIPVTFTTQYARIYFGTQKGTANGTLYVTGIQLEMGNKITGWKQSADDLQGQITDLNTDYSKNKINWNGIQSTVDSWKGAAVNGVTTIKGGLLQTGTITADKLFLGDTTNLCENPDFENDANGANPTGFTPTNIARVKDISAFTAGNGSNRALEVDAVNGYNADVYSNTFIPVTPGQKFYVEAEGRFLNTAGSGIARLGFSCYSAKKAHLSVWSSAVIWNGTKVTEFTKKGAIWTVPDNCYYMYIWISFQNNGETTNKFYIDNIRINRAASAEMIVDGSITAGKLNVNEIFGTQAVISKIQTYDLSANRIVSGNLEVGGSQLAVGTAWAVSGLPNTNKSTGLDLGMQTDSGEDYLVMAQATANELFAYLKRVPMVGGKKVTVSYDYNLDSNVKGVDVFLLGSKAVVTEANSWTTGYDYVYPTSDNNHDEKQDLGGGWFRVRKTHTLANDIKSALFRLDMNGVNNGVRGNTRIRSLMVNYGQMAMDWQPHSDEDISIGGINARHIAANSITAREIQAGSITATELSVLAKSLVNNFSMTKTLSNYTTGQATCTIVADPLGTKGSVMKMSTATDSQIQSDFFEVNPSKSYRFKVAGYIPTPTATTSMYFGLYVFNENKVEIPMKKYQASTLTLTSPASNPYFWIGSGTGLNSMKSGWVDMEGILTAVGTEIPAAIPANKNVDFTFLIPPEARYAKIRFFHHYSKTSVDSYWAHPSVTEIDSGMITFDQAQGGTLKLGTSTGNGFLQVVKQGTNGQQDTVGQIDETGAYFPRIQADEIIGGVIGIDKTVGQVFFDTVNGKDNNAGTRGAPKRNMQPYIDQMGKYIANKIELIQLNGDIDSPIFLKGFLGPGSITVRSDNSGARKTINSGIVVDGVTCQLYIQHFIIQGQDRTKAETGTDSLINVTGSPNVDIWYCKLYGNGKVDMGITGVRWAFIRAVDIEIYNVTSRAFSIIYHATAYIKNCKGGKNPYSILSSDYAVVQGEGTRPDGTVARWANSYIGGYMGDGLSWRNDIWTVDYGEVAPPPPPPPSEYVREWNSLGGQNWSANGYWDDEIYVKQGNWGYGDRTGVWWFSSDLANTLRGKTILEAQLTITRYSKGGNSGAREARVVAHQYADNRPPNNPLVSGEFVSDWFSWGETKTMNITSFVQQKIANGVDKGFGLKFDGSSANYMAFLPQAKLWVKYK